MCVNRIPGFLRLSVLLIAALLLYTFDLKAQPAPSIIPVTAQLKDISLLNKAQYSTSRKNNTTLPDLQKLKWKNLDTTINPGGEFADTVRQFWISFTLHNNFERDTTIILKLGNKMQQSILYTVQGGKLSVVGETGFGSKISSQSISGDYSRIYIPLKHGQTKSYYLLIQKYLFRIVRQYPHIQTFDFAYEEKNQELITSPPIYRQIKLWVAGFYFAVFVYCALKYFYQRRDKPYLYYALASISLFLRYSLQVDAILLESNWWPSVNNDFFYLLSFIPQTFFYILFLSEFLEVRRNKALNFLSKFCLVQWLLMILVMIVHYISPELTSITKYLWIYNSLPLAIFTLFLAYHIRTNYNHGYLKFAFVGVLTISFALLYSLLPKWLNIENILPGWYYSLNRFVDIVTVAFVIDTILFLTALAYRDREDELERINLKIKNAENEHKILRLQMNPHFIFNCLNSINLYIEKNDKDLATSYLGKFSKLMRFALDHSRKERISLGDEIAALKLYLEMETMRFKGKLEYLFEIDENLDLDFIEIPPLLIQPHVENAVWHGLMHKNDGGKITLGFKYDLDTQVLNVSIADNGIGRKKAATLKSKAVEKEKSYGTTITNERIEIINRKFNSQTSIVVKDLYKNGSAAGTLVILKIHLI